MTAVALNFDHGAGSQISAGRRRFVAQNRSDDEVSSTVKSAGRVFRILELFADVQRGMRVSELADRLSFPQSSTSALLKCMVQLGYLDCDRKTRTYIPSARVAVLGSWLDSNNRSGNLLHLLESLARQTGHTVLLAVRNGLYSQNIHILQSTPELRKHFTRGARQPLVWSETGYALLSSADDKDIRLLCTRTNAERQPSQPLTQVGEVMARVREVRHRGRFVSRGLITPGVDSVSMLLPGCRNRRANPIAIGVVAPQGALAEADVIKSMEIMRRSLGTHC